MPADGAMSATNGLLVVRAAMATALATRTVTKHVRLRSTGLARVLRSRGLAGGQCLSGARVGFMGFNPVVSHVTGLGEAWRRQWRLKEPGSSR
jgi:hypothetical protein